MAADGRSDYEKSVQTTRWVEQSIGDGPPPSAPRSRVNVRALPLVLLDPEMCRPYGDVRVYDPESPYAPVAHRRHGLDGLLRESIRYWRGNLRPAFVQRDAEADEEVYVVRAGVRRWATCLLEGLSLEAKVLPPSMPEGDVARLVAEDNTTAQHRDPVLRMEEALEAEPAIRRELAGRRHLGPGGRLPDAVDNTTFYAEVARRYFHDLGHNSPDHIRKLYVLVTTACGRGTWFDSVSARVRGGWLGDGPSPDQQRLVKRARALVEELREPPADRSKVRTTGGAYRELETLYRDLRGEPGGRRVDGRSPEKRREAAEHRAAFFEDTVWGIAAVALHDTKPWALMTDRDRADLVAGLAFRDWSLLARRWPFVIRFFLDVSYLMTEAHVHSRSSRHAIDLARSAMTDAQATQLSAALHQLGALLRPSAAADRPDWWKTIDVVWPPLDPEDARLRGLGLNLGDDEEPPTL